MSSRRQRSIPLGGRYRQVSLYNECDMPVQWEQISSHPPHCGCKFYPPFYPSMKYETCGQRGTSCIIISIHSSIVTKSITKWLRFALYRKFASGKQLESLVHRSFTDTCNLIDKENGQPFDPFPKVTLMVYNILASMAFGKTWVFMKNI